MSTDILNLLLVFSVALLLASVAMSLYLLYDIKSGNYRKFLSTGKNDTDLADKVQNIRSHNVGE